MGVLKVKIGGLYVDIANIANGGLVTARARAYLPTANQTIAHNTWTKLSLTAESYDTGSNFDTTNKRFVAPSAGVYLVSASVQWAAAVDAAVNSIKIYLNGSSVSEYKYNFSSTLPSSLQITDQILMTAGQYIETWVLQKTGVPQDINFGADIAWMAIHLLSLT